LGIRFDSERKPLILIRERKPACSCKGPGRLNHVFLFTDGYLQFPPGVCPGMIQENFPFARTADNEIELTKVAWLLELGRNV